MKKTEFWLDREILGRFLTSVGWIPVLATLLFILLCVTSESPDLQYVGQRKTLVAFRPHVVRSSQHENAMPQNQVVIAPLKKTGEFVDSTADVTDPSKSPASSTLAQNDISSNRKLIATSKLSSYVFRWQYHYRRAVQHFDHSRFEEAKRCVDIAMRCLDAQDNAATGNRARLLLHTLRGTILLDLEVQSALSDLYAALKIDDSSHRHADVGFACLLLERFEDATIHLDAAIRKGRNGSRDERAVWHNHRGLALLRLGRLDESLDDTTRALELSGDARFYRNRAVVLRQLAEEYRRLGQKKAERLAIERAQQDEAAARTMRSDSETAQPTFPPLDDLEI